MFKLPESILANVVFPHPDSPTKAINSFDFIVKSIFFKTFSSSKQKNTFFNIISNDSFLLISSVLFSSSFKSKNLKIFLLAVTPFIATWKNDPNLLKGKKKSAENIIIAKVPPNDIIPFLYLYKATNIPTAPPPRDIISITLIEFNCITKSFIVSLLNFSACSSISKDFCSSY